MFGEQAIEDHVYENDVNIRRFDNLYFRNGFRPRHLREPWRHPSLGEHRSRASRCAIHQHRPGERRAMHDEIHYDDNRRWEQQHAQVC
jgi:hypothetical protein